MIINRRQRIMLAAVIVLFVCVFACQVHYYNARKTPEVRGVVLDIDTGKPVPGAKVGVTVYGYPSDPIASLASPPMWQLAGTLLKAGPDGRFVLPSQRPSPTETGVSWPSYIFWGPMKKTAIGVVVYTPDHITILSRTEGFGWKEDPVIAQSCSKGGEPESVKRSGDMAHGFDYVVAVKRAVTEKEWKDKCEMTINVVGTTGEPYRTWLFNDLTGYIERWPEGEKAGEYLMSAMWTTLVSHSSAKALNKTQTVQFCREDAVLLDFVKRASAPKSRGLAPVSYEQCTKELRAESDRLCQNAEKGASR